MRFEVLDIIPPLRNPISGAIVSPAGRFDQVLRTAQRAGSPQQVIDKILGYHALDGHDLQSIALPTTLPSDQQLDILKRFAGEVVPTVRAAAPTTLREDEDPYGSRPQTAHVSTTRSTYAYAH